jgi:hypothetical protein
MGNAPARARFDQKPIVAEARHEGTRRAGALRALDRKKAGQGEKARTMQKQCKILNAK